MIKREKRISKNKNEKRIILAIIAIIFFPNVNFYINSILNGLGFKISISVYFYIITYCFSIWIYIYSAFYSKLARICILIAIFIVIFTIILGNENFKLAFSGLFDAAYNSIYRFVFLAFPALLSIISLRIYSADDLKNKMYYVSKIVCVIAIITFLVVRVLNAESYNSSSFYMSYSYYLLFALGLVGYSGFVINNYFFNKIIFVIGSLSIIIGGSRGAVICILFLVAFYVFCCRKNHSLKKYIITTIILCLFIFVMYYQFFNIINILLGISLRLNIVSRNLNSIINDSFIVSRGREELFRYGIEAIKKSPIIGYGMFGENSYLVRNFGFGGYFHNIIIDIVVDFGIISGTAILIILFLKIIIEVVREGESPFYSLLICSIPVGLIKLFYTSTYIVEPEFFMLVGLIIKIPKMKVERKKNDIQKDR